MSKAQERTPVQQGARLIKNGVLNQVHCLPIPAAIFPEVSGSRLRLSPQPLHGLGENPCVRAREGISIHLHAGGLPVGTRLTASLHPCACLIHADRHRHSHKRRHLHGHGRRHGHMHQAITTGSWMPRPHTASHLPPNRARHPRLPRFTHVPRACSSSLLSNPRIFK